MKEGHVPWKFCKSESFGSGNKLVPEVPHSSKNHRQSHPVSSSITSGRALNHRAV